MGFVAVLLSFQYVAKNCKSKILEGNPYSTEIYSTEIISRQRKEARQRNQVSSIFQLAPSMSHKVSYREQKQTYLTPQRRNNSQIP